MSGRVRVLVAMGLLAAAACGGGGDGAISPPETTEDTQDSTTLFVSLRLGSSDDPAGETVLAAVDLGKGEMRQIASIGMGERWAMAPDGDAVAIAAPSSDDPHLAVIDTATATIRWELPLSGWLEHRPVWSHDGAVVAVLCGTRMASSSETSVKLVAVDASSGAVVLETEVEPTREGFSQYLGWTADDQSIVVGVPSRGVQLSDGTAAELPVPTAQPPSALMWSPGGDRVLRLSMGRMAVFSNEGELEITFEPPILWAGAHEPWSPDGRHLLLLSIGGDEGSTDLIVVDIDDSRSTLPTVIRSGPLTDLVTWSPRGDELAIAESNRLRIHPIDGGAPRDLIVLDVDEGSFVGSSLAWRNVVVGGDPVDLPVVEPLGTPGSIEALRTDIGTTAWSTVLPGQPIEVGFGDGLDRGTTLVVAVGRRDAPQAVAGIDPEDGEVLWTTTIGTLTALDASGDQVVVSTHEELLALDAHSGRIAWRALLSTPPTLHAAGDSMVVTAYSAPLELTARNIDSGDELWTTTVCDQCGIEHLSVGEHVYVAVSEHAQARVTASVVAIDPTTGEQRWDKVLCDDCAPFAGIIDTRLGPLVLTRDHAVLLDPTAGAFRWSTTMATPLGLAATDQTAFVLDDDALHAFDLATGERLWRHFGGYAVTAADDVVLTVGHNETSTGDEWPTVLVAREATSGATLWQYHAPIGPIDVSHGADIIAFPLPAGEPPVPEPGPAPTVLVESWRLVEGDPSSEYLFTRDDGALLECWSAAITDVHTFESYLDDRQSEAPSDPEEVTVDGRDGWLFEFAPTAFEVFWQDSGHTMALRSYDLTGDEFRDVVSAVQHVSREEWRAALEIAPTATDPTVPVLDDSSRPSANA